jgi:hypothetical protein
MEVGTDKFASLFKHNTVKAYGMRLGKGTSKTDGIVFTIRQLSRPGNEFLVSNCTKGWVGQGLFSTELHRESYFHRKLGVSIETTRIPEPVSMQLRRQSYSHLD